MQASIVQVPVDVWRHGRQGEGARGEVPARVPWRFCPGHFGEGPNAESKALNHEYGFELTPELSNDYDAVIITVPHQDYKKLDDHYFASITKPHAMIADLKGIFRGKISSRKYWSL